MACKGRVNYVTHWQCEQRGACKARVHTEGMVIVRRTNEHLHARRGGGEVLRDQSRNEEASTTIPGQLPSRSWQVSSHSIRMHHC